MTRSNNFFILVFVADICPYLLNCEIATERTPCPYTHHRSTSYEWRLVSNDPNRTVLSILSLEDGKALEKQFCNPDATTGELEMLKVNFNTMRALDLTQEEGRRSIPIQRISTPPAILCPKEGNTSNWIWYWQSDDPTVNWSEMTFYEEDDGEYGIEMGTLLERLYKKQQELKEGGEPFEDITQRLVLIGKQDQYRVILNFRRMTILMNDGENYEVRRRPDSFNTFVDWCYLDKSPIGKV